MVMVKNTNDRINPKDIILIVVMVILFVAASMVVTLVMEKWGNNINKQDTNTHGK